MGRKSSIARLPKDVRSVIDAELKRGRLTLDEILDQVRDEFGADSAPSRSALGRHKVRLDKLLEKHRQTNDIMRVLVDKVGDNESEMGRGIVEVLRMIVYDCAGELAAGGSVDAKAAATVALAVQRLAQAEDLTLKARERAREQAFAEAEKKTRDALDGIAPGAASPEALAVVRRALGLAD